MSRLIRCTCPDSGRTCSAVTLLLPSDWLHRPPFDVARLLRSAEATASTHPHLLQCEPDVALLFNGLVLHLLPRINEVIHDVRGHKVAEGEVGADVILGSGGGMGDRDWGRGLQMGVTEGFSSRHLNAKPARTPWAQMHLTLWSIGSN